MFVLDLQAPSTAELKLSEIVSALSFALDITEGQPEGHAVRSCMIGMRIARELRLKPAIKSNLFYALLLKDLGCSSNASKVCYLFGHDDRRVKKDLKTTNWRSMAEKIQYILRNVRPKSGWADRARQFIKVAKAGTGAAKELIEIRCDRGASIARALQMPEETALAIRSLDEHWDGQGHPQGLKREQIPLMSRIMCLAQTVEVFFSKTGVESAIDVAEERSGTWFDPSLVRVVVNLKSDSDFWQSVATTTDLVHGIAAYEPEDRVISANEDTLDTMATGFGQVIDAKSPWTYRHSDGVAEIATGIAKVMGFSKPDIRLLRRAALLHDIGKLGISNLILDKPGRLNEKELMLMRRHPYFTKQILDRVQGFSNIAEVAAAHHERLDGKGYYLGLGAESLGKAVRILSVSDMYEALAAKRPYRADLTAEEVMTILKKQVGTGICPEAFEGLQTFLATSDFMPVLLAA